jgi:MFS family permease
VTGGLDASDHVDAAPDRQSAPAPPTHKWLIAAAVMLGCALEVIDSSIVNVSLPHMQGSFSASVDEIAWVLTSYIVANSVMIPLTGWVSARFGRKRYFLASVSAFVVASVLCGGARTLGQMVIFRLFQGAAGAAMIPSSQAILMETFPVEEQQLAMATWGIGLMIAPILGPTLGGWITDNWNWRWNFYINVPLGTVAFLMVWVFVHDHHQKFVTRISSRSHRSSRSGVLQNHAKPTGTRRFHSCFLENQRVSRLYGGAKWIRTLGSAASAGPCAGCVDSPASLDEGPLRRILLHRAKPRCLSRRSDRRRQEKSRVLATTQQLSERLDADPHSFSVLNPSRRFQERSCPH